MGEAQSLDAVNRARYARGALPREYARNLGLQEPERVILERIGREVRGQPILDLGVGAGRTTERLRQLSDDYLGVDYSPAMIEQCRRRYPDASFLVLDARALHRFDDGVFALVMFSFNGIDCVDHSDRVAILRDVHRILRPGGWFVFSSHNREAPRSGYALPPFYRSRHPGRLALRIAQWMVAVGRGLWNRRRLRRFEHECEAYAVRNDQAHDHSLLTYYVRAEDQIAQLRDAGFSGPVTVHALDGTIVSPEVTCDDAWLYYAVRR